MKTIFTIILSFAALLATSQNDYFKDSREVYFEFRMGSRAELELLNKVIDIDHVSADNTVRAYATEMQFEQFLDLSYNFKVLEHPGRMIKNPRMLDKVDIREITDWDFYPTYEAYMDMMQQFADDYPDICEIHHIAYTYEEREIITVKISDNVSEEEAEPDFLYTATMHGDETAGYVITLRLIDYLLSNYGTDPRITNLVNEIEIYINPLANPDGTYAGGNQSVYLATRNNALGVNLNRNYPDPEDGPHPDGNPWQLETLGFMDFAEQHHFVMSCNIHGGAEVCNYPWDTWQGLHADDDWWVFVCQEYADTAQAYSPANYMQSLQFPTGITNGFAWYTISGGRQDYMTYFHQGREFTLEMSNTKLLPASQLPAHWEYNYRSLLNYMEQVLYGVRGTIINDSSGEPIRAEVFILDHEADSSWIYSDRPHGNYNRMVHEGTYDFRFKAPGYFAKVYEGIEVTNHSTVYLDVSLVPQFSGVAELSSPTLQVFPNPVTSNYFQVSSRSGIEKLLVFDISGKLLLERTCEGENRVFVDVSGLPANTYLLQVYSEGRKESGRVVIK